MDCLEGGCTQNLAPPKVANHPSLPMCHMSWNPHWTCLPQLCCFIPSYIMLNCLQMYPFNACLLPRDDAFTVCEKLIMTYSCCWQIEKEFKHWSLRLLTCDITICIARLSTWNIPGAIHKRKLIYEYFSWFLPVFWKKGPSYIASLDTILKFAVICCWLSLLADPTS